MIEGLLASWRGLRHLEHRGYLFIWANVCCVLLSIPLITAPAAWAGLIRLSYVSQTGPTAGLSDFWDGFRQNLRRGLVVAALNLVVMGVSVTNLVFYREQTDILFLLLRGIWIMALVGWLVVQFFMWPLLLEMNVPNLKLAFRNAVVMVLLNPLYTLGLWIGVLVIAAVSTLIPPVWLLVTVNLLAAVATGAVLDRLEAAGLRRPASSQS